jgi:hypothetical protein
MPSGKTLYRIACGAKATYTDELGNKWVPDQEIGGGKTWGHTPAASSYHTPPQNQKLPGKSPEVYANQLFGQKITYRFPVASSKVTVRLHFCESYFIQDGLDKRVFDVRIQGQDALTNFDISKEAGGGWKPIFKDFKGVVVTAGSPLTIELVTKKDNAVINGIEIFADGPPETALSGPTRVSSSAISSTPSIGVGSTVFKEGQLASEFPLQKLVREANNRIAGIQADPSLTTAQKSIGKQKEISNIKGFIEGREWPFDATLMDIKNSKVSGSWLVVLNLNVSGMDAVSIDMPLPDQVVESTKKGTPIKVLVTFVVQGESSLSLAIAQVVLAKEGKAAALPKNPVKIPSSLGAKENEGTWTVLFRSPDPSIWNTEVNKGLNALAIPLAKAPPGIQFLKMAIPGGAQVIIPMTNDRLGQLGPVGKGRFCWNGLANSWYGPYGRLGIFDKGVVKAYPEVKGTVGIFSGPNWENYSGWGFGSHVGIEDKQCYAWNGKEIPVTAFEISVKTTPLTEMEKKALLE